MERTVDLEFLEYLIKSIVDHPDDVKIERSIDDLGVLLRLKVHKDDMGQVVGRQGATATAVRSLLRIVGIKHNARVNLKIEEPEGSTFVRPAPISPSAGYSRQGLGQAGQVAGSFVPAASASASHDESYTPSPVKKFDGPVAEELGL